MICFKSDLSMLHFSYKKTFPINIFEIYSISMKNFILMEYYNCNVFDKIDLSNTKFSTLPRINNSDIKEIILPETL